jgi:hypothetical protein
MKSTRPITKSRPLPNTRLEAAQVPETATASPRTVAARSGGATNKIAKARPARIKRTLPESLKAARIRGAQTPRNSRRKPELWQKVGIPKSRDLRLLMPESLPKGQRFEAPADVAGVDDLLIAHLLNSRPDLAAEIERREEEGAFTPQPISARDGRVRWS